MCKQCADEDNGDILRRVFCVGCDSVIRVCHAHFENVWRVPVCRACFPRVKVCEDADCEASFRVNLSQDELGEIIHHAHVADDDDPPVYE
jgi:hypothetical protein